MAVKNTLKWTILAYASEPDKNYRYEGDIVEYGGKRYWVSLAEERVEFVGLVQSNDSNLNKTKIGIANSTVEHIETKRDELNDDENKTEYNGFGDLIRLNRY